MIRFLTIIVALLLPLTVRAREYDAESDIGLVAENATPGVAARNTAQLTAALEAQWSGGRFAFKDGHTGPVLDPIRASAKEFYFAGTIKTSNKIGGALVGFGSRSYVLGSGGYAAIGGAVTRFTRIDGEKGGALLRLRGAGFVVDGIEFRGQPYIGDPTGEGPDGPGSSPKGTRTPIGIEVEGHAGNPTTMKPTLRNCGFAFFETAILAAGGYYDDAGKFIANQANGELGIVDGGTFFSCDACFKQANQQAVCWSFNNCEVTGFGGKGYRPCVVFDDCGDIRCHNLTLDHSAVTIFRQNRYSQYSARLTCYEMKWDRGTATANDSAGNPYYLTLFEYAGPDVKPWMKWAVRISGNLSNADNPYHSEKLLQVPAAFDTSDILFDITRLPKAGFESAGGPWVRPKK